MHYPDVKLSLAHYANYPDRKQCRKRRTRRQVKDDNIAIDMQAKVLPEITNQQVSILSVL